MKILRESKVLREEGRRSKRDQYSQYILPLFCLSASISCMLCYLRQLQSTACSAPVHSRAIGILQLTFLQFQVALIRKKNFLMVCFENAVG